MNSLKIVSNEDDILKNLAINCHKGVKVQLSHNYKGEIHSCNASFRRFDLAGKALVIDHVDANFYKELREQEPITVVVEGHRNSIMFKKGLRCAVVGGPVGFQQIIFEVPEILEVFDKRDDPRVGFDLSDNIITKLKLEDDHQRICHISDLSLGGLALSLDDPSGVTSYQIGKEVTIHSIGKLCFLIPIRAKIVQQSIGEAGKLTIHMAFMRKLDQFSNYGLNRLVGLIKG